MANIEGLFNLGAFEKASENDILNMNINESAEVEDKCPSMDFELHIDPTSSGNKEIPVPGGDKEEPSVKAEEKEIPVPGGDKEKPDAKSADETTIPNPTKVQLDDETYNDAISRLQKSFKEAVDILDAFRNVERVHKTEIDRYNEYMESAMDKAAMDYINGPIFEKVDKDDKYDIKNIIETIEPKIAKFVRNQKADMKFYEPHTLLRFIITGGGSPKSWQHILLTRMWQVIGCITAENGTIDKICELMTDEFKEDLGEYKIIPMTAFPSLLDVFRTKFNWKNRLQPYFLIIDKKLPAELEKVEKEAKKEVEEAEKATAKEEKEEKKEEK